jgi:hypothetical protein
MKKALLIITSLGLVGLLLGGCGGGGSTNPAGLDADPPVGTWEVSEPLVLVPTAVGASAATGNLVLNSMRVQMNKSAISTYSGQLYTPAMLVTFWDDQKQLAFDGTFICDSSTVTALSLSGQFGSARLTGTLDAENVLRGVIEVSLETGKWYRTNYIARVPAIKIYPAQ